MTQIKIPIFKTQFKALPAFKKQLKIDLWKSPNYMPS